MNKINYLFPVIIITYSLSVFKIGDFNINKLVGWLTLLIIAIMLFTILRHKVVISSLLIFMVIFRVLALVQPEFYLLYDYINKLLFFIAGLIVFSVNEKVFSKQLLFIICICGPIMFLQMAGVSWVHYHNYGNTLAAADGGFIETLFIPAPLIDLPHVQFRPSGILWSNQPLGLLIIFSTAYFLFHQKIMKWFYYFVISSVAILSTSYYVYFSYIIILISILLYRNKYVNNRKLKIITGTIVAVIFFRIIFPGVNDRLWDRYDILNKIWVRTTDLRLSGIDLTKIQYYVEMEDILTKNRLPQLVDYTKTLVSEDYMTDGRYQYFTLIGILYNNLLLSAVILSFGVFFLFKIVTNNTFIDPLKYSKLFTLFSLLSFSAVNPAFDMALFAFLIAFPITLIFPNFINRFTLIKAVDRIKS